MEHFRVRHSRFFSYNMYWTSPRNLFEYETIKKKLYFWSKSALLSFIGPKQRILTGFYRGTRPGEQVFSPESSRMVIKTGNSHNSEVPQQVPAGQKSFRWILGLLLGLFRAKMSNFRLFLKFSGNSSIFEFGTLGGHMGENYW